MIDISLFLSGAAIAIAVYSMISRPKVTLVTRRGDSGLIDWMNVSVDGETVRSGSHSDAEVENLQFLSKLGIIDLEHDDRRWRIK